MSLSKNIELFEVQRAESAATNYRISAKRPLGVPSILCPTCGQQWIRTGLVYPNVPPSKLTELEPYLKENPISPEQFRALSVEIDRVLGTRHPVYPGSMFGPLVGRLIGTVPDIAFHRSWEILLRHSAYIALLQEGIRGLIGVPSQLRSRGKAPASLVELQLEAHGQLARRSRPKNESSTCEVCGYRSVGLPEMWWVEERSLQADVDLFRLSDYPGILLATARFVEAVKRLNLAGAVFEPANVDPS